jgi:alpha-glucosidase
LFGVVSARAAEDIVIRGDGVDIRSGHWIMRVSALSEDILRVRAAADGELPEDASWAVPQETRARSVRVSLAQSADVVEFHTAAISVRIERSSLRIAVSDLTGHVISEDAPTKALDVGGSGFMTLAPRATNSDFVFPFNWLRRSVAQSSAPLASA